MSTPGHGTELVRLRLDGPPGAVTATAEQVKQVLHVTRDSGQRPSRKHDGHVLMYLDVLASGSHHRNPAEHQPL